MKKYYIYHIKGVKIGVSEEPDIRTKRQGYTEYEILEEHTCIYKVSDREIELQKQYGYKVDKVLYWQFMSVQSTESKIKGAATSGKIAKESGQLESIRTKENQIKGGTVAGKIAKESGQLASLRTTEHQKKAGSAGGKIGGKTNGNKKRICPYCGLESNGVGYFRYHGNNCKHKPTSV